jgi:MoaA/NifB/PqqE/SkfB family radical SAM enzyme
LPDLQAVIDQMLVECKADFKNGFIAESPLKIQAIHDYYAAFYGHNPFPYKKCNAPWVSTVIEADGSVRPCFFLDTIGNIHDTPLTEILNSPEAISFRKNLDMDKNPACVKCVCSLNLPPRMNPVVNT